MSKAMLGGMFSGRKKTVDLPVWGGDHRRPVLSPLDHHRAMARYEVFSTTLKTMCVVFTVLILFATIAAIPRMTTINYISDGSQFGCIVAPQNKAHR